jgi:hypothetical protein
MEDMLPKSRKKAANPSPFSGLGLSVVPKKKTHAALVAHDTHIKCLRIKPSDQLEEDGSKRPCEDQPPDREGTILGTVGEPIPARNISNLISSNPDHDYTNRHSRQI